MSSSCSDIRERAKECLSHSDCMVKDGKPAKECAQREAKGVNVECKALVDLLFQCKRGMLDARQRFRGSKSY